MLFTTMRLFTTLNRVTWAAAANSASTRALSPISQSKQVLFSASGQTAGCPASVVVARSVTDGSTS